MSKCLNLLPTGEFDLIDVLDSHSKLPGVKESFDYINRCPLNSEDKSHINQCVINVFSNLPQDTQFKILNYMKRVLHNRLKLETDRVELYRQRNEEPEERDLRRISQLKNLIKKFDNCILDLASEEVLIPDILGIVGEYGEE